MKDKPIRLSPSTLGLYRDCPRCFWIELNPKVKRPRGIFPSLPGGMDLVIKDYFDLYRGSLPPELEGQIEGVLFDDADLLKKWRNWRTGLTYTDENLNAQLFGALDDCLLIDGKQYTPLDYKTRGSAPKEGASEMYYQHQLDAYAFLLNENGFEAASFAYLVYYYPKEVHEGGLVQFHVDPVRVEVSTDRARKLFEGAVELLRGDMPKEHKLGACEYAKWHELVAEFD